MLDHTDTIVSCATKLVLQEMHLESIISAIIKTNKLLLLLRSGRSY